MTSGTAPATFAAISAVLTISANDVERSKRTRAVLAWWRASSMAENDASNTIVPGLEAEFVQQATAFADWCNAAGGINGRKIELDNRDAALFNAGSQMTAACQTDFMAVGGGFAIDAAAVPIREKCGLGQISAYVPSIAGAVASDQVDPGGTNTNTVTAGWFGALTKAYPKAVKMAGMGSDDTPSDVQPETKDEFAAEAQGWKVVSFLLPPTSVENWAPYVESYQQKGVTALWPADTANFPPFAEAMTTAAYHPAFVILGTQFANSPTENAVLANPTLPPVYVETQWWPLSWPRRIPRPKSSSPPCTNTQRATKSTSTTRSRRSHGSCGPRRPRPAGPLLR